MCGQSGATSVNDQSREQSREQSHATPATDGTDDLIARSFDRWSASLGREFGPLSRPQRRTLHTLADREAAEQVTRVGDIAAMLRFTTAGATRLLDTLEALGYVTRYRAPNVDQRQVYLTLTLTGRAALEQADRAFTARVAASLGPLSAAERQTLAALLARLTPSEAPNARAIAEDASAQEASDGAASER
jgi:DNA-binding MarR family transcriptional regulator